MSVLVDLTTAKQQLMIGHSQQDTIVQIMADGAEAFLAEYLGIKFGSADYQEDLDSDGLAMLLPSNKPVTALTIQDGDTYPSVLDRVTGERITVALIGKGRVVRADPGTGVPILQPNLYDLSLNTRWPYWTRFIAGIARYRVNYTAGYLVADVPPQIKMAALQLIFRMYQARGGELQSSAKGATVQWGALMDSDILKLVRPFSLKSMART